MPISSFFARTPAAQEQELKFHVPRESALPLRRWMDSVFCPHDKFADGTVCSVYFDTADCRSYGEKEASHYRKTKYRLRWYADHAGRANATPAYLEIKEKHGTGRRKHRAALPVSGCEISNVPLTDGFFRDIFKKHRGEHLPEVRAHLIPVLELRYRRFRYTHPVYRSSFCLDTSIGCTRTHPAFAAAAFGRTLCHDVLEQKSASADPLPPLRALPRFGARRAALSKYFLIMRQLNPDHDYDPS